MGQKRALDRASDDGSISGGGSGQPTTAATVLPLHQHMSQQQQEQQQQYLADTDDVISLDSFSFEDGGNARGIELDDAPSGVVGFDTSAWRLNDRTAADVHRQMRAAMAPAPYASSSEGAPASRPVTQPRSVPERDDASAGDAREEPRGLGLLTRMARQRGVVIVSSSGSDRSSGCAESPDRYDLSTALQAASMEDTDGPASDGRDSDAAPQLDATTPTSQPDGDGAWFAPRLPLQMRPVVPPPVPFVSSFAMPGAAAAADFKDDAPRPAVHAGVRLSEPALWLDRVSRWLRDGERQSSSGGKKSTAASL